ncbi:MAG: cbb3-type cytochrome c oxidase subunit 3 [Hyphomonadaceae bacterium]|nr:cbb3-type cytochrome c oxidase subunit 3 [Hyphomonadaceae bacterium]
MEGKSGTRIRVVFSKSWGLFYLIAMAVAVCDPAFWPSNRRRFDQGQTLRP